MKIEFVGHGLEADGKAALAVLVAETSPLDGAAATLDERAGGSLRRAIDGGRFNGAKGQTLDLIAPYNLAAARVVLVGVGAVVPPSPDTLEAAGAQAYNLVKASGVETRLVVKKGEAHGWKEWHKDMATICDWFDAHLKPSSSDKTSAAPAK